ncbi:N-acetyltransferase family protein [Flexivirga sp. B27]
MSATVRHATPDDLPAIRAIYGREVRETVATFDFEDPPESYWRHKLDSTAAGDHVLVVEDAGDILGYTYSSSFRPRPAYERTRETSIYLRPDATGRGLGRWAYTHLLELLRSDGMHIAIAVVAEPNPASCALHESLGFRLVGTLHEVGRKFDRWIDTRWYQLELAP